MPIYYCENNGKYRIGSGECVYENRETALRAYQAYLAQEGKSLELKEETYNDYP